MELNIRDEILEAIWMKQEQLRADALDLLKCVGPEATQAQIEELVQDDYLTRINGKVTLSQKGRARATTLVRSHRLSERLFTDVMELGEKYLERNACSFEHFLSEEVLEAICTLLGHPTECPHGYPIPPGECCKRAEKNIKSIIVPLPSLKSGESGKIVYVVTKHHHRLDHLTSLGILPAVTVKMHQTFPSYVVRVGQTDIAMDNEVIQDIYVRKIS
ncbi:MAG: FeoA domain-containing protein [Planctomycetes bacterium]|nr:FeoA domain-containing protein [Planctomycetota bacterium]